ncbi:hypothetical protein U1Q18_027051 [Sarracenia purpurea var. burkii]
MLCSLKTKGKSFRDLIRILKRDNKWTLQRKKMMERTALHQKGVSSNQSKMEKEMPPRLTPWRKGLWIRDLFLFCNLKPRFAFWWVISKVLYLIMSFCNRIV